MTRALGILLMLGTALFAEGGSTQIVQTTKTEIVPFQPGGTIHFDRSYGYLSVEGWDRPEVEVTVIKTLKNLATPQEEAEAAKQIEKVKVTAEKKSETELEITTLIPHRSRISHPFGSNSGVMVEYQIHAPRNSKLTIQHRTGDVIVTNINADIQATAHAGDIVVMLPETGKYSIDARSRVGTVSSDFAGDPRHSHWIGEQYAATASTPGRRIYLRVGIGGITIKESPKSAQPPVAVEAQ